MFEIKIKIFTPDDKLTTVGKCNGTRCMLEKGKRHNICIHCPIWIKDREHQTERKNAHERIRNVFYVQKNVRGGCLINIPTTRLEAAIDRIFKEEPIEGLK